MQIFNSTLDIHLDNGEFEVHPDVCANIEWEEVGAETWRKTCGDAIITIAEEEHVDRRRLLAAEEVHVAVTAVYASNNSNGCEFEYHGEHAGHSDEDENAGISKGEIWAFAIIATVLVCALSLVGILMLVAGCKDVNSYLTPMLSLSVGTLLGSTALSLIPEAADVIGFDAEAGAVMLAGIMFGLLTEKFLHVHQHTGLHGAPAGKEAIPCEPCDEMCPDEGAKKGSDITSSDDDVEKQGKSVDIHFSKAANPASYGGSQMSVESSDSDDHDHALEKRGHLATINLVGDAIHNFIDGALIGVTFLVNTRTGVTVALAIAAHEIPQELGDFGVLLHAGFSIKQALLLNLAVACTAILGCVLALAIGEEFEEGSLYMLPFASGLFVYLALAGLIPELMKSTSNASNKQKAVRNGMTVIGWVFVGIGIMALLLLLPEGAHSHGGHGDDHSGHAGH